jgi:hypothetical protein
MLTEVQPGRTPDVAARSEDLLDDGFGRLA